MTGQEKPFIPHHAQRLHDIICQGYMQMLDTANYSAFISPNTYMKWMDPNAYDFSEAASAMGEATEMVNPANVFSYMTSMLSVN